MIDQAMMGENEESLSADLHLGKRFGILAGTSALQKAAFGKYGYRGIPIIREFLGGANSAAGVSVSRALRNTALASTGLGYMVGGPVGALAGFVASKFIGSQGLLSSFVSPENAQKMAYGVQNGERASRYALGSISKDVVDTRLSHRQKMLANSNANGVASLRKAATNEVIAAQNPRLTQNLRFTSYDRQADLINSKKIPNFENEKIYQNRERNIDNIIKGRYNREVNVGNYLDKIASNKLGVNTSGITKWAGARSSELVDELRILNNQYVSMHGAQTANAVKSAITGLDGGGLFTSRAVATAKLFGGTVSQGMNTLHGIAAMTAGYSRNMFMGNLRYLMNGRKRHARIANAAFEEYFGILSGNIHGDNAGRYVINQHYRKAAEEKLSDLITQRQSSVTRTTKYSKTNERYYYDWMRPDGIRSVRTTSGGKKVRVTRRVSHWEDAGLAVSEVGRLEQHADMLKALGLEEDASKIMRGEQALIDAFRSGDDSAVRKARAQVEKNLRATDKTYLSQQIEKYERQLKSATLSNDTKKINSLTTKLNTSRNKLNLLNKAQSDFVHMGIRAGTKARLIGLGATAMKWATVGSLGLEVLNLGLQGVWKASTAIQRKLDSFGRREFGSGRAVSTEGATSERSRALQMIQSNRMQASSYLGMEAQMRASAGYN